jgi:hypothetical protein
MPSSDSPLESLFSLGPNSLRSCALQSLFWTLGNYNILDAAETGCHNAGASESLTQSISLDPKMDPKFALALSMADQALEWDNEPKLAQGGWKLFIP